MDFMSGSEGEGRIEDAERGGAGIRVGTRFCSRFGDKSRKDFSSLGSRPRPRRLQLQLEVLGERGERNFSSSPRPSSGIRMGANFFDIKYFKSESRFTGGRGGTGGRS